MNKQNILEQYHRMAPNFMTPKIKDWLLTDDGRILELSTGEGLDHKRIWGVTELAEEDHKLQTTRRGKMFSTLIEARRYFNLLNS